MAVIGSATLNIVPKVVGGLANAINGEMAKANLSAKGREAGSGFMSGFASGASIGTWSAIASKAIGVLTSSLDLAASRVDTLNNYPRIMGSLGVSTEDANRSIQTMSDALQNVPTKLDDMANTVQGLYAATSRYGIGLGQVTDAGLALNSMLLAGGQSQTVVNSAMEQFRQMVSKGKPELQDWKALVSAAPGQMNKLAESMLGASATADDLYAALGGGKEGDYDGMFDWGSLGMDEFIVRFAGMREEFEAEAEAAQGGISTAFANMQNAVTRGVAGVMESFGQQRIAGALGDIKDGINAMFGDVQRLMPDVVPVVQGAWDKLKDAASQIGPVLSDVLGKAVSVMSSAAPHLAGAFDAVVAGVKGIAPVAKSVLDVVGKLAPVASRVVEALAPIIPVIANVKVGMAALNTAQGALGSVGKTMSSVMESANGAASLLSAGLEKVSTGLIGMATAAGPNALGEALLSASDGVGALAGAVSGPLVLAGAVAVGAIATLVQRQEGLRESAEHGRQAISGFSEAVSRTDALDSYGSSLSEVGQVARDTTDYLSDMTGRWQGHADAINSNNEIAAESVATWERVRDTITQGIGATDLSAEAYGRLKWAVEKYNEEMGESLTAEEVMSGYEGQGERVDELKSKIEELTQKRIEDARAAAYTSNLEEAYKAQADAQKEVADAQGRFNDIYQRYLQGARDGQYELRGMTQEEFAYNAALSDAASVTVDVNGEQMALNDAMGQASEHLSQASDAVDRYSGLLAQSEEEASGAADAYARLSQDGLLSSVFERQGKSVGDFVSQLRTLGGDVDANATRLSNLSQFELTQLAASFDGTSSSILGCLGSMQGWDGAFDEAAVKAAYASQQVSEVGTVLEGIGVGAEQSQQLFGTSLDALSTKLAEAGVSTQTLADVGSEGFSALAASCQGNVDLAVSSLAMYNAVPVEEKDGQIVVNDAPLMDAEGHIYTYNGLTLEDHGAEVSVDYAQLVDSQGSVFEWNGTTLTRKSASATASGNVLTGTPTTQVNNLNAAMGGMSSKNVSAMVNTDAASKADEIWNAVGAINSLYSKTVTVTTNYVQNGSPSEGHAAGGIRLNAAGGYRYHAAGSIVDAPGRGYPLDMVGEDGAEAIVPLTNRRYAKPFVDMLADGIAGRVVSAGGNRYSIVIKSDGGDEELVSRLTGALRAFELTHGRG